MSNSSKGKRSPQDVQDKKPSAKSFGPTPSENGHANLVTDTRPDHLGVFNARQMGDFQRKLDPQLAQLRPTDLGNAERLVERYGPWIRFCHPWKRWLVWDGKRWKIDDTADIRRKATSTVRSIYHEASTIDDNGDRKALINWAFRSETRTRIDAMIDIASSRNGVTILPGALNKDAWLLNCRNGTLDLRTGELRPHRMGDLITQLCKVAYNPDAPCHQWDSTLQFFFDNDDDLIEYWRRLCGSSLSGVIREHIMPIAYGTGSNGKSTILGALLNILGPDYAMKSPPDLLMSKRNDSHPTERADLFGKRLVVAIETESGRKLNETMVKELTGGDRIRARRMKEDFWEFSPTHKIIMSTNHKPAIHGTDHGIWRRVRLVPFEVTVADDKAVLDMSEKLKSEYSGILAWLVRGCLEWQRDGLRPPASVVGATSEYKSEEDRLGRFLDEKTVRDPIEKVQARVLYVHYCEFMKETHDTPMSETAFGRAMYEHKYDKIKSGVNWYIGISLRSPEPSEYPEFNTDENPL